LRERVAALRGRVRVKLSEWVAFTLTRSLRSLPSPARGEGKAKAAALSISSAMSVAVASHDVFASTAR